MNWITDSILAFLFGAGLMLAGADSKPWNPWLNVAGVALMGLGACFLVLAHRRR